MLRKKWQALLLSLLSKHILDKNFYKLKSYFFKNYNDGFYVHAKPNFNSKHDAVNYIIRYTGRPVMAQSRIIYYDGSTVTFWYKRHEDDKKVYENISVFDFIKRLIIHIPEYHFKMIRYYGLYSKKYKFHSLLRKKLKDSYLKTRRLIRRWRERILYYFGYNPTKCSCGSYMIFVDIFVPSSVAIRPP